jgi:hypothetical protein
LFVKIVHTDYYLSPEINEIKEYLLFPLNYDRINAFEFKKDTLLIYTSTGGIGVRHKPSM